LKKPFPQLLDKENMKNQNIGRVIWMSEDKALARSLVNEGIVDAQKFVDAFNAKAVDKRTPMGISSHLRHEEKEFPFPDALRESFNAMFRPIQRSAREEKRKLNSANGAPFITVKECMEILGVSAERVRQLTLVGNSKTAKVRKSVDPKTNLVVYSKPDILAYKQYRDNLPALPFQRKLVKMQQLSLPIPEPVKPMVAKPKTEQPVVRTKPQEMLPLKPTSVTEVLQSSKPVATATPVKEIQREKAEIALKAYDHGFLPADKVVEILRKMIS
jgi:hypothetical protein